MPANFTGSLAISGSLIVSGSIFASGSITISGSIASASFATTASNAQTASSADNFFVRQNVTASNMLSTGRITAQTLVVQTVTSSIVYSSGSNIFGNLLTDTQQFTGSMFITGSSAVFNSDFVGVNCSGISNRTMVIRNTAGRGIAAEFIANDGCATIYIVPSGSGGTNMISSNYVRGSVYKPLALSGRECSTDFVLCNGSVGIGTSTPGAPLEICTTTATSALLINGVASTSQTFFTFNDIGCNGHCAVVTLVDNNGTNKLGGLTINTYRRDTQASVNYQASNIVANGGSVNSGASIMEFNANAYCDNFVTLTPGLSTSSKAFRFSSQGVNLMTITVGGCVGIGTCTPGDTLHVQNCSSGGTGIIIRNSCGATSLTSTCALVSLQLVGSGQTGQVGVDLIAGKEADYSSGANRDAFFAVRVAQDDALVERMRITSAGYVGIGTLSPNVSAGLAGNAVLTMKATTNSRVAILELVGCRDTDGDNNSYILAFNNSCTTAFGAIRFNRGTVDGCGSITFGTSGVDRMTITCNGFVVIGQPTPEAVLTVCAEGRSTGALRLKASATYAAISIGGTGALTVDYPGVSNGRMNLTDDGYLYLPRLRSGAGTYALKWGSGGGEITYDTSSERYKNNIRGSIYGLSDVLKLNSKMFEYKDTNRTDVGLIAEEVYCVIPELVALDDNCLPNAVSYDRFVSVLVKAIQEQQCQICSQSIVINQLKTCLGIA